MTAPVNKHMQSNLMEMVKDKLLLERITLNNIDVNPRDAEGRNALYWAIKSRSTHNTALLISFGSSLVVYKNTHALFHAIECQHHEIVVLLIEKGLDINMTNNVGKTALMCAIESELFETVRYLMQKGADAYLMDDGLNMAEDYAKLCNSELIKTYIQHIVYRDMQENTCKTKQCTC